MTTKKISELTELIALSDTDAVPLVHAGVTKRISAANLKASVLGGTVTATNFAATSNGAGTSFKVGDDAWIGDINIGNSLGVRGIQDGTQGYIVFGNANSTSYIGRNGTAPITVTGAFAGTANITAAGSFVSTATGSAATNGGQIVLNGATSNRIDFAGVGLGDPNASSRSAGTKIVLWPQIDGSGVDYAIGLTSGVLWNSVHDETKSFKWFANTTAVATLTGTGTLTVGNINAGGNIIPITDNVYTLGSSVNRWKSAYIGPGSIYIQDTANAAFNAELSVTNGVLLVNGANQLQVGQLKFVNNTIESTTGATDIQIGLTGSTANLLLNRNVAVASGKTLTFGDGSVQTTAAPSYCGSFYSTQTQYVTANRDGSNYPVVPINPQKTAFTFNNTDTASTNGVSIVSNSRITFAHAGTYNIAFSVQMRNFYAGGAQNSNIAIWLSKNGTDVPTTATWSYYDKYDKKQAEAWNFFITVAAGDYCELMWWDKDGNTEALYEAGQTSPVTIPDVPSIILTVNQVK